MSGIDIIIVEGNATAIKAETLVTAINLTGTCYGEIDRDIRMSSRNLFHKQVQAEMPLTEGQVVYAPVFVKHGGRFKNMVFVADNKNLSVYELMTAGLKAASKSRSISISVPSFLCGSLSRSTAIYGSAQAIADFASSDSSNGVKRIFVVVSSEDDRIFFDDELWRV